MRRDVSVAVNALSSLARTLRFAIHSSASTTNKRRLFLRLDNLKPNLSPALGTPNLVKQSPPCSPVARTARVPRWWPEVLVSPHPKAESVCLHDFPFPQAIIADGGAICQDDGSCQGVITGLSSSNLNKAAQIILGEPNAACSNALRRSMSSTRQTNPRLSRGVF